MGSPVKHDNSAVLSQPHDFDRPARAKRASNFADKRLVVLQGDLPQQNVFDRRLKQTGKTLFKASIEILQINLGKLCNLTCHHCHVEASPDRTEMMDIELQALLLERAKQLGVKTIDLTGGAPEMFPGFKGLVRGGRELGCEVIVRSNLTILIESGYEDYVDFFRDSGVRVIASLPCYTAENVDKQRGNGVFDDSIEALKRLNAAGFGKDNTGLTLDLVFNPGGPRLPGNQSALEKAYKKELLEHFGIEFNSLFVITNLPIGRFYSDLKKLGKAEEYDRLLRDNFNTGTVDYLMCRNTLSISWDGWLYDCDFNQMIELPIRNGAGPVHICDETVVFELINSRIETGNHCFGCTAGAGSSCVGELV